MPFRRYPTRRFSDLKGRVVLVSGRITDFTAVFSYLSFCYLPWHKLVELGNFELGDDILLYRCWSAIVPCNLFSLCLRSLLIFLILCHLVYANRARHTVRSDQRAQFQLGSSQSAPSIPASSLLSVFVLLTWATSWQPADRKSHRLVCSANSRGGRLPFYTDSYKCQCVSVSFIFGVNRLT